MKNAKFMLAGIAIVGVVGGAMAFNAKKNGGLYCSTASQVTPPATNYKTGTALSLYCTTAIDGTTGTVTQGVATE